ncbi:MAG: helix-turn-helix transcriptional regulator [Clostridia bacterium]|nr:helix-turn-helix transcriptional regulator [Clostridia bacterium]
MKQLYCIRLKELRKLNSYSQSDIAYILCIRQEQYSKYESGLRELPLHLLTRLCMIYHVSADYLLGLDSVSSHSPTAHMFDTVRKNRAEI